MEKNGYASENGDNKVDTDGPASGSTVKHLARRLGAQASSLRQYLLEFTPAPNYVSSPHSPTSSHSPRALLPSIAQDSKHFQQRFQMLALSQRLAHGKKLLQAVHSVNKTLREMEQTALAAMGDSPDSMTEKDADPEKCTFDFCHWNQVSQLVNELENFGKRIVETL